MNSRFTFSGRVRLALAAGAALAILATVGCSHSQAVSETEAKANIGQIPAGGPPGPPAGVGPTNGAAAAPGAPGVPAAPGAPARG